MELEKDAQKILELRERRAWTQEKLAQEAEIDVRTVQRLEAGERVGKGTKARLLQALGSTPEDMEIEQLKDRMAEMAEEVKAAKTQGQAWPPLTKEGKLIASMNYYRHPYHEIIPYSPPVGAPVPRVGEFVVLPKRHFREQDSPVESFKVIRVLYAYECYVDAHVRVQVDVAPATNFD